VTLLERVARPALVIEPLGRSVWPLNELKVATGMIRMAARACSSSGSARVKSSALFAQQADLAMACQAALSSRLGPPAVTRRTPQAAVERRVRARERAGRDLRVRASGNDRHR
jgi:hypothetical protein